jgi:hypothetical protein
MINKMNRVRAGLRIPMDLNTELALYAQKECISKNALIVQILTKWLKMKKREENAHDKH